MSDSKLRALIYEDEQILIVNKPSGLLTVPAPGRTEKDLTGIINDHYRTNGIYPCHRLDKETSGVLVFAKGRPNQQKIMDQFRSKKVKKTYIAFVQGRLEHLKGTLKNYIQGAWPYKRNSPKKLAITKYKVIKEIADFSVLELEPVTGRTNQIRLQFKNINHPLIGERRFVLAKNWPIKFKRVALHAFQISLDHPLSNKRLVFQADLPKDMKDFLLKYGQKALDFPDL